MPSKRICLVQLGRYGDLMNILPAAMHLANTGHDVEIAVTPTFSDLLEGVTYATPRLWSGNFMNGALAAADLHDREPDVDYRTTRIIGTALRSMGSYVFDAWEQTRLDVNLWHDVPLVFDNRDLSREDRLIGEHAHTGGRPLLLTCFAGVSSPAPQAALALAAHLREQHGDRYHIVDLGAIRAQRLYDLLGLYEVAAASGGLLVSIDSAPLHLAHAAPQLPVIALINDGWLGSAPRRNWAATIRYADIAAQRDTVERILHACPHKGVPA